MTALRHPCTEFPAGVTPAEAIAFALASCGLRVGQGSKTVRFILYALDTCGFQIVPINHNVVPFRKDLGRPATSALNNPDSVLRP